MSEQLEVSKIIKSIVFGFNITIKEFIAEGGQGEVYKVDYNGKEMALKWYKPNGLGNDSQAFYDNIRENINKGAPSSEFLWPIDLTEWVDGSFGYVMDLRPDGFYEITEYMLRKQTFRSYKTIIDAALHIVHAFRQLHNKGFSYQDLNDGNFFINPKNGKVLICDNDNVAPDGTDTGILGKPRYMAPEIVVGNGKKKPNSISDMYSMSLIIYILFCLNHPLEGKKSLVPAFTPSIQEKLYGSEPVFMFDKDDDSNRPHPKVHRNSILVWSYLPKYMKEMFMNAFSKKCLTEKPSLRPKEVDWIKALTRFRSDIVQCKCGNEVFIEEGKEKKCENCGFVTPIPFRLAMKEYCIPALKDSRIYRCQIGVCNAENALNPVAQVVEKKDTPGLMGIRNKTEKNWDAITSKGVPRKVAPEEVIPLKDGIKFKFDNETVEIKAN